MCILCVIQKWSRRVATMLPWLVIPLIGLWALSQLLPPPFRFDITSPRLACVFVLLLTLFWYEILMPQLSAWRLRRNAMLRERKRFEVMELQKLKKTATRKCRNCLTPYRDQNPCGGKFMCSYCGHISRRPVLDLPISPGLGISNSGIIKDLFGNGGNILNGKVWSDNGSVCLEWLESGKWVISRSLPGKSAYPRKSGINLFGGNNSDKCSMDMSYSGTYFFPRKWLIALLKSIRWLWIKLFRISLSREDNSSDVEHRGMFARRGDKGGSGHESRLEKARRKAEEKRQARLEKELLEEEERKQREDVARLVEERRRLRDEKIEAESRAKSSLMREKARKEAEKKRQDQRKGKGSCKSNSDVEMEKKAGKENECKRETDQKYESDHHEPHRTVTDSIKCQSVETAHGVKGHSASNVSRGNAGARYFDRVKGSFLSSSKALTGGSFFGKVARNPAPVSKESKSNNSADYFQTSANRRELDRVAGGPIVMGDEKSINCPKVMSETQHRPPPKSWHQLFTKSPTVPASSSLNVISRPNFMSQAEVPNPLFTSSPITYDKPIHFGLPSPFSALSSSNGPMSSSPGHRPAKDSMFPLVAEVRHDSLPDEPELFQDPCSVSDPVALLGPVSESLDNFQFDLGNGFIPDEPEKPCPIKVSSSLDASRPSPIESPLSRFRAIDEKLHNHTCFPTSPKAQDMHPFPAADLNNINKKTWKMWDTSPLGQDGLDFLVAQPSWVLPLERSRSDKEDVVHTLSQRTIPSLFTKDDLAASGSFSAGKMFLGNSQNSDVYGPSISVVSDHDPWLQKAFCPLITAAESYFAVNRVEETQKQLTYQGSSRPPAHNSFDASPTWSKNERALRGYGEVVGNPSVLKPRMGG